MAFDPNKLPYGMAPAAFNAFKLSADGAAIDLIQHPKGRLTQTIGNAKASAGFHARDGFVSVGNARVPYCAAVDLSVLWLTTAQIKSWLSYLAWWGFAAWYRPWYSSGKPNFHIHGVYAGLPMKDELDDQTHDFLNNRTGLVGHALEKFYTAGPEQDAYIRALWLWSNKNGPKPPLPPLAPKAPAPVADQFGTVYHVNAGGREREWDCPAIDGTSWVPVRPWFEMLGLTRDKEGVQQVKWMPEDSSLWVQGRKLALPDASGQLRAVPIRLINLKGQNQGYAPVRELVAFSGLKLDVDNRARLLVVSKPTPTTQAKDEVLL